MKPATLLLPVGLALFVSSASAEELRLRPRQQPGDSYLLSLTLLTDTEAASQGVEGRSSADAVRLSYQATVVVLEVDRKGRPVRERHEGVRLGFQRPQESGDLFEEGTSFEVRRARDGTVQLLGARRRADEEIARGILATRFEHTLEPALLDPGRPVEVGASWELDPSLVRRVLRERDVRVLRVSQPATATLHRVGGEGSGGEWAIRYSIPIAWCEPTRMPANTTSGDSEARLEGEVRLDPETGAPLARSFHLTLRMQGVTAPTAGLAEPVAWRVQRTQIAEQRIVPVETASGQPGGTVVSEHRPR